ncbi:unnamed protein product [Lasius platythorax]
MHARAKEEEPEAEARTKGQSSFSEASFPIIRAWRSAYSACIQSSIYSRRIPGQCLPDLSPGREKSSKYSFRSRNIIVLPASKVAASCYASGNDDDMQDDAVQMSEI